MQTLASQVTVTKLSITMIPAQILYSVSQTGHPDDKYPKSKYVHDTGVRFATLQRKTLKVLFRLLLLT
jgi:hypothetical protein